jgi:hypothetical protein
VVIVLFPEFGLDVGKKGFDFFGCLPFRFVFLYAEAGCEGVNEGDTVANMRRSERDAFIGDRLNRFLRKRAAGFRLAQDHASRFSGKAGDIGCGFDGPEIHNRGAAWYQDEVGHTRGGKSVVLSMGRGVDNGEVRAVLAAGFKEMRKPFRVGGNDSGRFALAAVPPFCSGGLSVKVDNGHRKASLIGGDGQVDGKCAFSGSALL